MFVGIERTSDLWSDCWCCAGMTGFMATSRSTIPGRPGLDRHCPRSDGLQGHPPGGTFGPGLSVQDGGTRHEHSLGVYLLLGRLGAGRKERIAGLLHDISHTAFSHAVDFVFASEEQDHHEGLKPEFLGRPDLSSTLASMDYQADDFFDDSIYPLLEQPLPWLCADRLDYFFRDSLACGVTAPEQVQRLLDHLVVIGTTIAFDDLKTAREATRLFALMNRDWVGQPDRSLHLQRVRRRHPRGLPPGSPPQVGPAPRR